MSGIPSGNIGIPVKLLHESEGHTVSVELKTGEVYRGHLVESEDNMNMTIDVYVSYIQASRTFTLRSELVY